jgi:mannose-6-phosphate isomerase-like protein (cupin superfamily)
MCHDTFPAKIRTLEPYSGRFSAFRLQAHCCDVLFASYPAGTSVEPHTHTTENWGVVTKGTLVIVVGGIESRVGPGRWYHVPARAEHSARFDVDTETIEFWFECRKGTDADARAPGKKASRHPVPAAYQRGAP